MRESGGEIHASRRKTVYPISTFSITNLPFFDNVEMLQVEMLLQEPRLADLKALHTDSLIAT